MAKIKHTDYDMYLEKILRSGDIVTRIINEVKSIQAVESGKFQVVLKPTSLLDAFECVKFIFEDRLKNKDLTLELHQPEQDIYVEADEHSLINNVLCNLISNAIKFSEPKSKIVVQFEQNQGKVHIHIRDFGIGMPSKLVKNLFKQDKETTRLGTGGEKGTGFGMPITKIYMEKYGGQVNVISKEKSIIDQNEDHGTTFILTFNESCKAIEINKKRA